MNAPCMAPVPMQLVTCANCSTPFYMPSAEVESRRQDHETFFCPRGHRLVFKGKSEIERLRERIAQLEEEVEEKRKWAMQERRSAQEWARRYQAEYRRVASYKAHFTRVRRELDESRAVQA